MQLEVVKRLTTNSKINGDPMQRCLLPQVNSLRLNRVHVRNGQVNIVNGTIYFAVDSTIKNTQSHNRSIWHVKG